MNQNRMSNYPHFFQILYQVFGVELKISYFCTYYITYMVYFLMCDIKFMNIRKGKTVLYYISRIREIYFSVVDAPLSGCALTHFFSIHRRRFGMVYLQGCRILLNGGAI